MTFDDAFQTLGNDGQIKRTSWPAGVYVAADGNRCSPSHLLYCDGINTSLFAMQQSYCEDFVAEDWEEVGT